MTVEFIIDIKDILISTNANLSLVFGTNLFISKEPTTPASVVTLFPTGSSGEPNPKYALDYDTFQVRVRGEINGFQAAYDLCRNIYDFLLGKSININSDKIVGIWATSSIIFLQYDDSNRPIFTMNFRTVFQPANTGNRIALG